MTDTAPASTPTSEKPADTSSPAGELSDLDKIKAAQAARRSRRTRPPTKPPKKPVEESPEPEEVDEVKKLQTELSTMRLEMVSLRRNHLTNLKKVTEERDMFATQLAKEQNVEGKSSTADAKKASDMAAQLRASRTRNNDLESENAALRDDVKQLNFRVQAGKTLAAANDGYERIVDELVTVKLKCAQLQEEKEDLLKINKDLTQQNAHFRDATGELEKSRSSWVVQCAELEKQRAELEKKMKAMEGAANPDTSYKGSDLHNVNLN